MNKLIEQMKAMRDRAYVDYIGTCRKDECLGVDAKIACGEFGRKNLESHCKAHEYLGRHIAINDVVEILLAIDLV